MSQIHKGLQQTLNYLRSVIAAKQGTDTDLTAIANLTPIDNDLLQRKASAWTNRTPVQVKADLALTKTDVGLANVDNTSDATKNSAVATLTNKVINNQSLIKSQSVADQTINAATTALLTGSVINVPSGNLQAGSVLKWRVTVSKTAAGTAANTFLVKLGTAGTTADATIITFTTNVGTAVVDSGVIEISVVIRSATSTTTANGSFELSHNLASTGLVDVPNNIINVTSAAFDATVLNLKASIACTTAAATVLTFQQVVAEADNL